MAAGGCFVQNNALEGCLLKERCGTDCIMKTQHVAYQIMGHLHMRLKNSQLHAHLVLLLPMPILHSAMLNLQSLPPRWGLECNVRFIKMYFLVALFVLLSPKSETSTFHPNQHLAQDVKMGPWALQCGRPLLLTDFLYGIERFSKEEDKCPCADNKEKH